MRARTKHFLRSWRTFAGWGVFDGCEKKIDDKEAAYSDHEIRRKQEKIMDVFYQFGELMNLDPCDEKVQKAAEETAVLNLPGRSCGNSIKQDRNRCFSHIIFHKFLLISA